MTPSKLIVPLSGASTKTYTLTSADVDHTVRVCVAASNADGQAAAFSKPPAVVSDSQGAEQRDASGGHQHAAAR